MKKFIIILTAVLLFSSTGANAYMDNEINIYASPSGDDIFGNGSLRKPYKTPEKVNEKVKLYMKSGTKKNINAVFRGGEYYPTDSLTIDSLSKFGYDGKVTYKSYTGERAEFFGGKNNLNWENTGNGIYRAKTDNEVRVLYEDGEPSVKARYPNKSENRIDGYLSAADGGTTQYLKFNSGDIPKLTKTDDLQICVFDGGPRCLYSMNISQATVDYDESKISFSRSTQMNCTVGSKYYICNSPELLDAPGEMYYSESEGAVYYKPRNADSLPKVYASYLTQAFRITGTEEMPVKNVSLSGIDIKYFSYDTLGAPAVIYSYNAENIEISDCGLYCIGGQGIEFYYTDNSRIMGNRFENIGAAGIFVRDTHKTGNVSQNVISDNYIKNVGFYIASSNGIDVTRSSKNSILNNTVTECTRAAINLSGLSSQTFAKVGTEIDGTVITRDNVKPYLVSNDNVISGNDLSDCMLENNDGGVIYTWATGYDNEITNNYIHDSGADFSFNFGAIYLDDDTNRSIVRGNYIERLGSEKTNGDSVGNMRNILLIKGQDNLLENNFIINCKPSCGITRADSQSGTGPVGNVIFKKNISYNSGGSPYGFYGIAKEPENPLNVKFKECNNNIYYDSSEEYSVLIRDPKESAVHLPYIKLCGIPEWKSYWGWDTLSVIGKAEFTDTYTDDFRLSGNGYARLMGIDGIDISKCGVGENYKFTSTEPLDKLYLTADNSPYSCIQMSVGEQKSLKATAKSKDGVPIKDIKLMYFSSDKSIVSVQDGYVTANKSGKAKITAVGISGDRLCTAELYFNVK